MTREELVRHIKPAIEEYLEVNSFDHGEISVKAVVHNGKVTFVNVNEEEKIKFS